MKKLLVFLALLFVFQQHAGAIEDPVLRPNNKVGIHILFPNELSRAGQLVNSNGGKWGYVTIPIQSGDKDLEKWQAFMDLAKQNNIIPIIRISTEGDYFNTKVWRKPTEEDILDFANFLSSLEFPTKNRYIIVFNETNRGDEWGGKASAEEYAKLLSYAVTVFKSKSNDFFIISGGLDNAAATNGTVSIDSFEYLKRMNQAVPGIFNQIDGLGSHSYPNPAFAKPAFTEDAESIATFRYENQLIEDLGSKKLPVFITETGWSSEKVNSSLLQSYYKHAFENVWNDPSVIAVTPFILSANAGPFTQFAFLDTSGNPNKNYQAIESIAKVAGSPSLSTNSEKKIVLAANTSVKEFNPIIDNRRPRKEYLYSLFQWFLRL